MGPPLPSSASVVVFKSAIDRLCNELQLQESSAGLQIKLTPTACSRCKPHQIFKPKALKRPSSESIDRRSSGSLSQRPQCLPPKPTCEMTTLYGISSCTPPKMNCKTSRLVKGVSQTVAVTSCQTSQTQPLPRIAMTSNQPEVKQSKA